MIHSEKHVAFINRKEELAYLHDRVGGDPERLLFVFGPKSSGKTTLLYKFAAECVEKKEFDVKYFNLRKILIVQYQDFIRHFFGLLPDKKGSKETNVGFDFKLFSVEHKTLTELEQKQLNPFMVMEQELQKLNAKGVRPIIIIDELQALEDVYLDDQRQLLKEVFNFFVAMTKESHLCHVIVASSDGYFLQRIYDDSKLKKTSTFFEVEYLSKEDVYGWLTHLEKESGITSYKLSPKQIDKMWDFFGGSCWEISDFLDLLRDNAKNGKVADSDFDKLLAVQREMRIGNFEFYMRHGSHESLFAEMAEVVKQSKKFTLESLYQRLKQSYTRNSLCDELNKLVSKNFLAFNPVTTKFELQGRSMEIGLTGYAELLRERE
ncbi:MAG: ATP-binding protein [Thermoguttaceae bacterium]